MKFSIPELLAVNPASHDENWLKNALQSALELELATLPPYLCALWSITDTNNTAYEIIRSIILEEMLHFALVCNMLTAIGGIPEINNPAVVPRYPGGLPGKVKPGLSIYLAGLSKDFLRDVCIPIEAPEQTPITGLAVSDSSDSPERPIPSIGAFYDAILSSFKSLSPHITFRMDFQLVGHTLNQFPLFKVSGISDVEKAIQEIKQQGEGTRQSPNGPDTPDSSGKVELAHFYKFKEIYHGKKLVFVDNKWTFDGEEISFPKVQPMSRVPVGGYESPPKCVQNLLDIFNNSYAIMLNLLQAAWKNGSQDSLSKAIGIMFTLKRIAVRLMAISLPDGTGTYGPDFLIVKASDF
jgi:hypothetical protein